MALAAAMDYARCQKWIMLQFPASVENANIFALCHID
jgi:hypothetical protein